MKKLLIIFFLVFTLRLSVSPAIAAKCLYINSGQLLAPNGDTIVYGSDAWGYNYRLHVFKGEYCNSYRGTNPSCLNFFKNTNLEMRWNDAWLSTRSCDGDFYLDQNRVKGSGAYVSYALSGSYPQMVVDQVNIGDIESEVGHKLSGWSDQPWRGEGDYDYGGGDDYSLRTVLGPGKKCSEGWKQAILVMNSYKSKANKITLRHLDSSANDGFKLYLLSGGSYRLLGEYTAAGDGQWHNTSFNFSPRSGSLGFKIIATGSISDQCSAYGQLAFSYAEVEGIYSWSHTYRVSAVPKSAVLKDGVWYTRGGREIGPADSTYPDFALTNNVVKDPLAERSHNLQFSSVSKSTFGTNSGLSNW